MAVGIVSQWVNNHLGYFNAISGKRDGDYSVHRAQLRNQLRQSTARLIMTLNRPI